jgi:hypothetical protein
MKIFDPHVHMTSRTTDDYAAMAAAGVYAIVEPAFWLGQPRTSVGSFVDYFNSLLGWERFRARQFGIWHFCTIALNPKEANNPKLAEEVLELMPRFLQKDGVVAVGEVGFDDQTDEEERFLARQIEMAREYSLPVLIHTPHRDKKRGTERTIALVRSLRFPGRARADRSQQRGDAAAGPRDSMLGGTYDLSEHQDGRGADGGARQEIRSRSHPREQRGRLGHQRPAQGAEDGGRHA